MSERGLNTRLVDTHCLGDVRGFSMYENFFYHIHLHLDSPFKKVDHSHAWIQRYE